MKSKEPITPEERVDSSMNGEEIENIEIAPTKERDRSREISPELENELIKRAQLGDNEAIKSLLNSQIGLIRLYARRFKAAQSYYFPNSTPIDLDDLIQSGVIGLIEAINKWDEEKSKGGRLSTFANYFFRNNMMDQIKNSMPVPIPRGSKLITRTKETQALASNATRSFSLDDFLPVDEDDSYRGWERRDAKIEDRGQDVEAAMLSGERREMIKNIIDNLDPNEEFVIKARFFDEREPTLKQVADKLNLSRERIRQIEASALNKIRNKLKNRGVDLGTFEF